VALAPLLIPNLGAEEGPAWRRALAKPAVAWSARLWRCCFPASASTPPALPPLAWPSGVPASESYALPELDGARRVFAWWETPEAVSLASACGLPSDALAAEAARVCHDKAFAQRSAAALGLEPACWRGLSAVLEPTELRQPRAADAILERVRAWPAWTQQRFTLKPRFGTSGRGRAGGRLADADSHWIAALPRLAARGGCVLEPWVERRSDLAVELVIGGGGEVQLLGSLRFETNTAGVPLGHRGVLRDGARSRAGTSFDAELESAAIAIAQSAARAGLRGACGVDAFVFVGPGGDAILRPVVELNARFTLGHAALAIAKRLRQSGARFASFRIGAARDAAPADRMHALFSPAEQRAGAPVFERLDEIDARDQRPTRIGKVVHSA
jgi:hypothetical protein